jgi:hypothetical protein
VAKQIVLDETAKDGRTLRQEVLDKFKEDNSTSGLTFSSGMKRSQSD